MRLVDQIHDRTSERKKNVKSSALSCELSRFILSAGDNYDINVVSLDATENRLIKPTLDDLICVRISIYNLVCPVIQKKTIRLIRMHVNAHMYRKYAAYKIINGILSRNLTLDYRSSKMGLNIVIYKLSP